jgi:hypothetical protein
MKHDLPQLIAEGTEPSIATARELLRASEKRHIDLDLGAEDGEPSGVDWYQLQKVVSRPTMSERLLHFIDRFDDATVAWSGVLPPILFTGAVVVLYEFALRSFPMALLCLGISYVVIAVSFLWGAAAWRAYGRVTEVPFPPSSILLPKSNSMRFATVLPVVVIVVTAAAAAVPSYWNKPQRKVNAAVGEASVALSEHRYSDALLTFEQASKLLEDDSGLYMTIGKSLYDAAMNLDRDDPKQRKEQVRLAKGGISYLEKAASLQQASAEPQIRIAELQYVLGERAAAWNTVAEIEKLPKVSPADLARAGLILAAIAQEQVADARVEEMSPEQRAALDENLKHTAERLQAIRDKTHSPEIASAVATIYLTRAAISAPPDDRSALTALALRETLAASARREVAGLR